MITVVHGGQEAPALAGETTLALEKGDVEGRIVAAPGLRPMPTVSERVWTQKGVKRHKRAMLKPPIKLG